MNLFIRAKSKQKKSERRDYDHRRQNIDRHNAMVRDGLIYRYTVNCNSITHTMLYQSKSHQVVTKSNQIHKLKLMGRVSYETVCPSYVESAICDRLNLVSWKIFDWGIVVTG